jgi:uncharacterized protein DUF4145
MAKQVPASIKLTSFNCPHCEALAHQTWYRVYVDGMEKDKLPFIPDDNIISMIEEDRSFDLEIRQRWIETSRRLLAGEVFINQEADGIFNNKVLYNVWASECFSCEKFSLWLHGNLIYPAARYGEEPNEDLSSGIKHDYEEARSVLDLSPRAAAALLRLCIQKICGELGESGTDLNHDIGNLVARGLDVRVQQALDIVRVIGNNAVHPGQIDLRDNRATATRLFSLVNLIAEKMISEPKHIKTMFDALPESSRTQIEKRDNRR